MVPFPSACTFIGQTLLPLWGTCIGTVLAYFGKANFEAASKSYQDAIKKSTPGEKIAKLLVKDACKQSKISFTSITKQKVRN